MEALSEMQYTTRQSLTILCLFEDSVMAGVSSWILITKVGQLKTFHFFDSCNIGFKREYKALILTSGTSKVSITLFRSFPKFVNNSIQLALGLVVYTIASLENRKALAPFNELEDLF